MAALVPQQISRLPAVTQTFVVPDQGGTESTGGNTVPPDDRVFLEFENTNAAARTITVYVPAAGDTDQYGRTNTADLSYSLAATTGRRRIGPLDRSLAQADGMVHFTVDANAGVTCAALRI